MRELLPSMGACLPWDPRGHRHLPGHPGTTGLLSLGLNMSQPFSSLTNLDFFLGTPSNHSLDSNRVTRSTESTFTHNGVSSKHHPAVDGLHHLALHLTACTHERAVYTVLFRSRRSPADRLRCQPGASAVMEPSLIVSALGWATVVHSRRQELPTKGSPSRKPTQILRTKCQKITLQEQAVGI